MNRYLRGAVRFLAAGAALASLAGAAPSPPPRLGSSFAIVARPAAGAGIAEARPNRAMIDLQARPVSAVTLGGAVPAALAAQFGAKTDVPFAPGTTLYGWPERPRLYCDLLRLRGLGMSAACLNDADLDGKFEEGLRLDFYSNMANLLVLSASGKIIGANFTKTRVPLPQPVAYAPAAAPAPAVLGKLALRWRPGPKKQAVPTAQLWISTPENHTGTEGLSEKIVVFDRRKVPLDVEIYGIRLRVHGFTDKGAMRYSLLGMADGTPVPLLFRGYTFHIMFV